MSRSRSFSAISPSVSSGATTTRVGDHDLVHHPLARQRRSRRVEVRDTRLAEIDVHLESTCGRRSLGGSLDARERAKEGREVAPDDLGRRPPQRVCRDEGGLPEASRDFPAQVARQPSGQQDAAENGPEGGGLEVGTRGDRDRARGHIGLLRGDPALLDGEARRVAGRVHISQSDDEPVRIDRDEAFDGLRDAADAPSAQARKRDRRVHRDCFVCGERQGAVDERVGVGAGVNLDAGLGEQRLDRLRRRRPEQHERLALGCHEDELDASADAGRRHERQLVRRQRPDRARRNDERQTAESRLSRSGPARR